MKKADSSASTVLCAKFTSYHNDDIGLLLTSILYVAFFVETLTEPHIMTLGSSSKNRYRVKMSYYGFEIIHMDPLLLLKGSLLQKHINFLL